MLTLAILTQQSLRYIENQHVRHLIYYNRYIPLYCESQQGVSDLISISITLVYFAHLNIATCTCGSDFLAFFKKSIVFPYTQTILNDFLS